VQKNLVAQGLERCLAKASEMQQSGFEETQNLLRVTVWEFESPRGHPSTQLRVALEEVDALT
jgi:hypothetical protein